MSTVKSRQMNYGLLVDPVTKKKLRKFGKKLSVVGEDKSFPIVFGVPRFSDQGYAGNFGYQWKRFDKTQLDNSKHQISESRFFAATGWEKTSLRGKKVLEVGSGAGRFTRVVLDKLDCSLATVDYSEAVEVNYTNNIKNNKKIEKTIITQASIYDLPFPKKFFDKVFCFGVLQHTPNFEKSVEALVSTVKVGGEIVVDFYPINGWWTMVHSKYLVRPFTKRIEQEKMFRIIDKHIDKCLMLFDFLVKIKLGFLTRFIPIADLRGVSKILDKSSRRELAVLDTLDMLSPTYDNPQRTSTVSKWFKKYGAVVSFAGQIDYKYGTVNIVRAIRKN